MQPYGCAVLSLLIAAFSQAASVNPSTANETDSASRVTTRYLLAQPDATPSSTTADLGITLTPGSSLVIAGNEMTYEVTITNVGPAAAKGARFVDFLPRRCSCCITTHDVAFVSATQRSGPTFDCGSNGRDVNCSAEELFAPGASASFTFVLRVASYLASHHCTYPNGHSVRTFSLTEDPNPANDSASQTIFATAEADVSVSKSAAITGPGARVVYTILLTNNGPSDAENVVISDPLPAGAHFFSASATSAEAGDHSITCSVPPVGGTGTVMCTVPYMGRWNWLSGSGPWVSFNIAVELDSSSSSNTATVSSSTADPLLANNSSTTTVTAPPGATIPTLSEPILLLLGLALAILSVLRMR